MYCTQCLLRQNAVLLKSATYYQNVYHCVIVFDLKSDDPPPTVVDEMAKDDWMKLQLVTDSFVVLFLIWAEYICNVYHNVVCTVPRSLFMSLYYMEYDNIKD